MANQQVRARVTPDEWVELEHKDIEGTHRAPASAVPHWERRGWKPVTAKKSTRAASGQES